ncbi:TetR/AcrR family transcriptional regulator [Amycolatopsis samaneae]|uniref:TetR/AcrR family transcriptional regulator n=1 Tax=Amycolatopsis samaneae TaxID=664691 RepID=A0ABW5G7P6_9PSEU
MVKDGATAEGTRDRLVRVTADLLQRQGYEATGVKEILAAAGATSSSLYHHFPGGKEDLAREALAYGAEQFAGLLRGALARADTPETAVAACALDLAEDLAASGWSDGCPVAVTALESVAGSPQLREASARLFEQWQEIIADRLRALDVPAAVAGELASTVLCALEGAELLSRVTADPAPLRTAARHLSTLVEVSRSPARGR